MSESQPDGDGVPASGENLAALRARLAQNSLDGFIVPVADEHQGEFVAARSRRLTWLTGFSGSAGLAVVLAEKAAIFVDGRYTLQVREQVDTAAFEPLHITDSPPHDWIAANLAEGARLGYDPWLHTLDAVERYRRACGRAGAELIAATDNPVDEVWHDQPAPPRAPAVVHEARYAGVASAAKRDAVGREIVKAGADAVALSAPDSIAWLLNMRGGDIPNTPVALCFGVLTAAGEVDLFIDERKITPELGAAFGGEIRIAPPECFGPALDALGKSGKRVLADPRSAPSWIFDRLAAAGAEIVKGGDPCALPKACKNEVELDGTRDAHIRDGAALTRFLAWLAVEAPGGTVDELSAVDRLLDFRAESNLFHGVSFETISGAGPNGAIVHYRVDEASNRRLEPGMVYLVDSGAQYPDGTTDVTRTVFIGGDGATPPDEARDRFTRVLKGHIALAMARFPVGTSGGQLDTLARTPLWEVGLDFDHGTGHGVGSYLGVHEGPARIGKRGSDVPLKPGMIMSNEPGYYKTGEYGIRIENLVIVTAAEKDEAGERDMLGFETITLAPIDRALIDPNLLTAKETAWLDAYHARVRETITPLVDGDAAKWLRTATEPLA